MKGRAATSGPFAFGEGLRAMVVMELGSGGAEPVSLTEAKAWCRIERNDEDALVGALIKAAREVVERETRLVLVKRGFRLALDAVPGDRRIAVPRRPTRAVSAVTAFSADGSPQALAATTVAVDSLSGGGRMVVSAEAAGAAAGGIEIEFVAGFEPGEMPEALRLAMKRIVAASYELRGAVPPDMQPGVVPEAARRIIDAFRERRL